MENIGYHLARIGGLTLAIAATSALPARAQNPEPVRIAFVDPLSGPLASSGQLGLNHYRYAVDRINAAGGVLGGRKLEIVAFDNKASPQETLIILKKLVDDGFKFISQGNSSAVAAAISDAVTKNNERNPSGRMLYMNYSAIDPSLTNDKCAYWHFRFDSDVDMKMSIMADFMKDKAKKIYLINQDYSFGHSVADAAKAQLKAKAPGIEIVGDEFHPLGKIKDFAPYIAKIKASGAQAVITGNFGSDLALLVRAAKDAGVQLDWYTYYAGTLGAVTAIGDSGVDHVRQISEWNPSLKNADTEAYAAEYQVKYKEDFRYMRVRTMFDMFAAALNKAGSDDPKAVAAAMSGMRLETPLGPVSMREDNHQLLQPQYVSTLGANIKPDVENTGLGWINNMSVPATDTKLATTCQMKRPD